MLAEKLFNANTVKMLLLSATPYKMYSTLEEIDGEQGDEHYAEFLSVMNFLGGDESKNADFEDAWKNYSVVLREFSSGKETIIQAKKRAEDAMYDRVCRTERVSAPENADIIDDESVKVQLNGEYSFANSKIASIIEQDINSYVSVQKLLDKMGANFRMQVDYIKSAPYLLSFMKEYQLKYKIEAYFKDFAGKINDNREEKVRRVVGNKWLWIDESKINTYKEIPSANIKLETLKNHAFEKKAEKLLWIPPLKPYYEPQGVYKEAENFSKVLVFSAWEMVPRMIAGLLSYEAERKTIGELIKKERVGARYFTNDDSQDSKKPNKKRFPAPRLNFALKNKKPNAMSLLCLLYPSKFLTDCYCPIDCLNRKLSLEKIKSEIKDKITKNLYAVTTDIDGVDKRWYYIAPILLDDFEYYEKWLKNTRELYESGEDTAGAKEGLKEHIKSLPQTKEDLTAFTAMLGKMPDDLVSALTDMAIASPAVCVNRTYQKHLYGQTEYNTVLASQIAKIFINRMNSPESTAVVELCYGQKGDDAHWRNLLKYCVEGNIQAMFDEYAHLITNGLDKNEFTIKKLHATIAESMAIKTASYDIDTVKLFCERVCGKGAKKTKKLRTHYAVAFTKGDGDTDKATDRKTAVRNAFNSPFRPFVLASTSIGQEGLDFHNYCRKIVHWNLPSNPIDLEQREGRINRFECLAIRQNIARMYGYSIAYKNDIWAEMFEKAVEQTVNSGQHSSDLIPFW
ncbi:MAG: helicase, partial [Clostridia bacterium]|nr:helicase [Clostridia bacterium]